MPNQVQDETSLNGTKNPALTNPTAKPPDYPRPMKKVEYNKRLNALRSEHMLWRPAYQSLSTQINQLRGKFDSPPSKRPQLPDHKVILDDHATTASIVMSSGLSSGMTSQSQPWLRLSIDGQENMSQVVREWLDECQAVIYGMLDRSNLYGCINNCYEELADFGTGCFMVIEDYDTIVRGRDYTIGEYYLGTDHRGKVNTFGRQFWMTVGQMVSEFGYENCSVAVRQNWDFNQKDVWYYVNHLIEPNDTRIGQMSDFNNMPFRSVYWDNADYTEMFLACRGFRKFPVIAPRWKRHTTDQVMGYGPGWYALGHIKQLQKVVYDEMISEEKAHNPPMQKDANVDHVATIPGGVTNLTTTGEPNSGVRPSYQIQHDAQGFQISKNSLYEKIDKHFFVNLFLMLMNVDKTNMTATEIAERQQEKIMMMGPILYNLTSELLDPLIELLWDIAENDGLLPEAPDEVQGAQVKVVYISVLFQALKALGVNQINRVIGYIANLNSISPEAAAAGARVFDFEESVREVSDMEGIPARLIRDKEVVQQMKDEEAQAQQQQMQMAQAAEAADSANKLARSPMGDPNAPNALDRLASANGVK